MQNPFHGRVISIRLTYRAAGQWHGILPRHKQFRYLVFSYVKMSDLASW